MVELRLPDVGAREEDYKPGDVVVYDEDNAICLVAVLENHCTDDEIAYRVKNLKTVHPHFLCGKMPVGAEFNMMRYLRGGFGGAPHLSDVFEKNLEGIAQEIIDERNSVGVDSD